MGVSALHDFHCKTCDLYFEAFSEWNPNIGRVEPQTCAVCGTLSERVFLPRGYQTPGVHPSEVAVVYEDPRTGHIRYPGTNALDDPIGVKAARQGYRRVELKSAAELDQFCKRAGVTNEVWHGERE